METWESRKIESIDYSRAPFDGSSSRMDFGRFVDNVRVRYERFRKQSHYHYLAENKNNDTSIGTPFIVVLPLARAVYWRSYLRG